jgi:hypothetical protein
MLHAKYKFLLQNIMFCAHIISLNICFIDDMQAYVFVCRYIRLHNVMSGVIMFSVWRSDSFIGYYCKAYCEEHAERCLLSNDKKLWADKENVKMVSNYTIRSLVFLTWNWVM